jgi:hypothetical protein
VEVDFVMETAGLAKVETFTVAGALSAVSVVVSICVFPTWPMAELVWVPTVPGICALKVRTNVPEGGTVKGPLKVSVWPEIIGSVLLVQGEGQV